MNENADLNRYLLDADAREEYDALCVEYADEFHPGWREQSATEEPVTSYDLPASDPLHDEPDLAQRRVWGWV